MKQMLTLKICFVFLSLEFCRISFERMKVFFSIKKLTFFTTEPQIQNVTDIFREIHPLMRILYSDIATFTNFDEIQGFSKKLRKGMRILSFSVAF